MMPMELQNNDLKPGGNQPRSKQRFSVLQHSRRMRFKKITISKNNQQLIDNSSWIFLAITPQVGNKILKQLYFAKNKRIVSFISTIKLKKLKKYTKNNNITRVIPLPFIGRRKGPIIVSPSNKKIKSFFKHLGEVIETRNEETSKGFYKLSHSGCARGVGVVLIM
mgnify:CR=1 FL=1